MTSAVCEPDQRAGAHPLEPVSPVAEFCAKLDLLRVGSHAEVPWLARQLGLSRTRLYAVLGGRIRRPPDWDRLVRPLVEACTGGDRQAVAAWRQRHAVLTEAWKELRRRDQLQPAGLRTGRSEPRATDVPRQLPAAVDRFTGRHAELAALTGALEAEPGQRPSAMVISAISGTAGVGKTALAVHWAYQIAGRFPDGQLYVNLRGYDPAEPTSAADALASLLRAQGVPGADIPDGADDRSRLYRSQLAGRRVLVLLDNARDADQVRPLLPGDPGCIAIVTSRDRMAGLVAADGAQRLDLGLLSAADAFDLLRLLIGSRVDDDCEAATALAGLCAGLPLALRIAAELACSRRSEPLRELADELAASRLDSLDAGEDCVDLRAVFSWSYRQLPSTAARLFALVALHPGEDFDVFAAAALAGCPPGQARRTLHQLHRASLIQAG